MLHAIAPMAPNSSMTLAEKIQDSAMSDARLQARPPALNVGRLSDGVEPSLGSYASSVYAPQCQTSTGHCCSCCGGSYASTVPRISLSV
jgi:hypothetical protein